MGAVAMQGEHSKLEDFLRRYFARIVAAILFGFVATWLVTEIFFDTVVTLGTRAFIRSLAMATPHRREGQAH